VEAKFVRLTKRFLKESEARAITSFVWNIERQRRVAALPELCVVR
jgi:hypothetical protein